MRTPESDGLRYDAERLNRKLANGLALLRRKRPPALALDDLHEDVIRVDHLSGDRVCERVSGSKVQLKNGLRFVGRALECGLDHCLSAESADSIRH